MQTMQNISVYENELYDYLSSLPIISTHSHDIAPDLQVGFGLFDILQNSYVAKKWIKIPFEETKERIAYFTKQLKYNTYFYWLEKSLQQLYHISKPLNEHTYWEFDEAVRAAHANIDYPKHILREKCGFKYLILDLSYNPGSYHDMPDLFKPAYRSDMFLMGYDPKAVDHNNRNAITHYKINPDISLDDYIEYCQQTVRRMLEGKCVCLKCNKAYDRSIYFADATYEQAKAAYRNPNATLQDIVNFQDFMQHRILEVANDMSAVVEWHTGLGRLIDSSAIYIRNVVEKYPNITFDIFHGSYPWMDDLFGLVHNYGNVRVDLCWLPVISTEACVRFIKEMVQVGKLGTMMWGNDTWTPEEAYGTVLAARKTIARAFAELIKDDMMDLEYAKCFCRHIMYENAAEVFHLSVD
jgi:hypothetical protein